MDFLTFCNTNKIFVIILIIILIIGIVLIYNKIFYGKWKVGEKEFNEKKKKKEKEKEKEKEKKKDKKEMKKNNTTKSKEKEKEKEKEENIEKPKYVENKNIEIDNLDDYVDEKN